MLIGAGSPADVDDVHILLAQSFPPAELLDRETLAADVAAGSSRLTVARDENGALLGVAVLDLYPAVAAAGLSYLAVHPRSRGLGTGRALCAQLEDEFRSGSEFQVVFLEIEFPDAPASAEFGDPARRVAFYARLGIRIVDVPYFQPGLAGGPRVPMMLGVAYTAPTAVDTDGNRLAVPGALRRFVLDNLVAMEGIFDPDDPETEALLAAARVAGGPRLFDLAAIATGTVPAPGHRPHA